MVHVTRRAFMEGAAALPATASYANPQDAVSEVLSGTRAARRMPNSFLILLGGPASVHEDRLLVSALRMFPALASFEVQSRMNSSAALWALAAHGNGLVCSPCREFSNAVLDGLPLVSVAQISAGPDRCLMLADQDDASPDDMSGARLLARSEMDRQRWDEVARARRWSGYTFVNAPGSPANVVAAGAARAALVSAYERGILETLGAPVRFVDVHGLDRAPSICVVAHRRSIADPVAARSVRLVISALATAEAIERKTELQELDSADVATSDVLAPEPSVRTLSREAARGARRSWFPRRFGAHDAHAWRSLVSHANNLRASMAAPSHPVWVNACLPLGVSRRLPLG